MTWVTDLVSAITGTFTTLSTAVIGLLRDGFVSLFLKTVTVEGVTTITGVSEFGIFSFVMIGISLCLSLTYFVVNMVRKRR